MDTILQKQGLTTEQLVMVQAEVEKNKKSTAVAFILWFFLGSFGAHRFYTGDIGYAIAFLAVGVLNLALGWITLYISSFLVLGWVLIDGFFLYQRLKQITNQIEIDAINKVKLYANAPKSKAVANEEVKEEIYS